MKTILDLLKHKAPKSAEIRAAIEGLASDAGELATKVDELRRQREEALLSGLVGGEVEEIERAIADKVRESDRTKLFREKLADRLVEAQQVEAAHALSERKLKAEVESRDLAKAFAGFEATLAGLADLLARDQENHREANEVDRLLIEAGLPGRVQRAPRPNFGIAESVIPTLVGAPS